MSFDGFFSWDCNVCGHPLLSPEATNPINRWMSDVVVIEPDGSTLMGEYDGYGRVNDHEIAWDSGDPCVYHRACWEVAGRPTEYVPSEDARDQGWFFDDPEHNMPDPRKTGGMRGFGAVATKGSLMRFGRKWKSWGGTTAFGVAQRDYYVVGYYAGDVPRRDFRRPGSQPRGFVYGSFGTKAQAEKHAKFLQKKAGGQAAHTIYEAVPYERAVRMFDLRI